MDEVPIGAVVVRDGVVIGSGFNQPISSHDPTAHAEIVALRAAARAVGNYRLTGSVLYVTVEPCLMCVGATVHARVAEVVYGAPEPKAGAIVSAARAHETPGLNHRIETTGGVLEDECRRTIQDFFEERRPRSTHS
jgi:tRNA(adenine34) deaminase